MNWINEVYSLLEAGEINDAIDIFYDNFDDLFITGCFDIADQVLEIIDINRLDTNLVVAVLSITLCAKDKLPSRTKFFTKAKERLVVLAPDRIERLLDGLE